MGLVLLLAIVSRAKGFDVNRSPPSTGPSYDF